MKFYKKTTHLSEILEESETTPVIILKYSDDCNSSSRLADNIENKIKEKNSGPIIYMITVQTEPVLSKKVENWFDIKHETPQIIKIFKGKVVYTAHHNDINIDNFIA